MLIFFFFILLTIFVTYLYFIINSYVISFCFTAIIVWFCWKIMKTHSLNSLTLPCFVSPKIWKWVSEMKFAHRFQIQNTLSYANHFSASRNCLFPSNLQRPHSNTAFSRKNRLMFPFSVATSVEILFNAILFNDTWSITNLMMTYIGAGTYTQKTIKSD